MLILVCAKYYVLETKNIGDMTKFSELPEQPSYNILHGIFNAYTDSRPDRGLVCDHNNK